ncbi:MAG: type II secretion system GspH family protein [Synergistaceae bacterium]|jgi:hypothetical protein|nr:type II secretion system GspH family protein [Synergistaceae bacterium]
MRARRGNVLPAALVVMLFLAILCAGMLEMAGMNIRYASFFAQRSILEQTTESFAQVLYDEILDQRGKSPADTDFWLSADRKWEGSFDLPPRFSSEVSPMRFYYAISPDAGNTHVLRVSGDFLSRDVPAVVLVISNDIWSREGT